MPPGGITRTKRANGTDSHYYYDTAGHLAQIHHQKADGSTPAQFSYQHDTKGHLAQAAEKINGQNFLRRSGVKYSEYMGKTKSDDRKLLGM